MLEKNRGWSRLSSLEPPDVNTFGGGNCCLQRKNTPFLHISAFSPYDATLARMGRVYRTELYRKAVEEARSVLPTIALGTDLSLVSWRN